MSNLVVYCDKESQVGPLVEQLTNVTAVHPARVLLLVGDGKTKQEMEKMDLPPDVSNGMMAVNVERLHAKETGNIRARHLETQAVSHGCAKHRRGQATVRSIEIGWNCGRFGVSSMRRLAPKPTGD